ncbi:MAG: hypothetical protein NTZ09_13965 [Candidatus Hydrogenedentes bacterium]|nr:hypothetical protein [Candidatus Hydrogenedentota bacterium]
MNGNDAAALHKEPQHAGVQLADVAQLKQTIAERFGQRLAVILAIPQLCQSGQNRRVVAGIALFEFFEELPHWCNSGRGLIEFYPKAAEKPHSESLFATLSKHLRVARRYREQRF